MSPFKVTVVVEPDSFNPDFYCVHVDTEYRGKRYTASHMTGFDSPYVDMFSLVLDRIKAQIQGVMRELESISAV